MVVFFVDLDGRSQAMTGFLLPPRQWTLKLTKICILSWISKGISWLGPTCNFSSHSQQKTIHTGHKSKGNDQQDKYLDVQQILMASSMGTAQRTVRRFCIYSDNSHRTSQSLSAGQTHFCLNHVIFHYFLAILDDFPSFFQVRLYCSHCL